MKKVLIAYSDKKSAEAHAAYLNGSGFVTDYACTSGEAIAALAHDNYAIVLSELELPEDGGESVCEAAKKNNVFFIMACEGTRSELRTCGKIGADAYIKIPFEKEELLRRIKSLAENRSWRAPRVLVKVSVESFYRTETFFCTSLNISETGMLLECDKVLAKDDVIKCSFFLPDFDRIKATCYVVRVEQDEDGLHRYGVEFTGLEDEERDVLRLFIRSQREEGNIN